jgi:hypothetical protein
MGTVKKIFKLPEDDSIFDRPDQQNIKANFAQLGYSSKYMSNNLGSIFVIILVVNLLLLLIYMLDSCKCPFAQKVNNMLKQKLLWNFVIRLVIESYLSLGFSVYFNLRFSHGRFSYLGSWVNYFYAVSFAAVLIGAPLFVICFYCYNFKRLKDEHFESKFGAAYQGLETKHRHVIAYTTIFMIRRAFFCIISLVFQ